MVTLTPSNFMSNLFFLNHCAHFTLRSGYLLRKDNPEAIWLARSLRHMAKTLPWTQHSMSIQNLQMVIELSKSIPPNAYIFPIEFIETLRSRVKSADLDAINLGEVTERLAKAGITLSAEDSELIAF